MDYSFNISSAYLKVVNELLSSLASTQQFLSNSLSTALRSATSTSRELIPYGFHKYNSIEQVEEAIESQSQHFETFQDCLRSFAEKHAIDFSQVFEAYWFYVLPLFRELEFNGFKNTHILGVLGVQGAGKTTFSALFKQIAEHALKSVIVFSIDDFYKTHADRNELKARDSRFSMRGPPGTHDIDRLRAVLESIRSKKYPIHIPVFDKSLHGGDGDVAGETVHEKEADIVVFEGWFTGLRCCELKYVHPILNAEDMEFAQVCAENLREYEELWNKYLDRIVLIKPEEYAYSRQWRKEAEHKMIKVKGTGMSDEKIDIFVDYFWKALHPTIYVEEAIQTDIFQLVVTLDSNHTITRLSNRSTTNIPHNDSKQ